MQVLWIEGNKLFRSILGNQFKSEAVEYVLQKNVEKRFSLQMALRKAIHQHKGISKNSVISL